MVKLLIYIIDKVDQSQNKKMCIYGISSQKFPTLLQNLFKQTCSAPLNAIAHFWCSTYTEYWLFLQPLKNPDLLYSDETEAWNLFKWTEREC